MSIFSFLVILSTDGVKNPEPIRSFLEEVCLMHVAAQPQCQTPCFSDKLLLRTSVTASFFMSKAQRRTFFKGFSQKAETHDSPDQQVSH